MKIFIVFSVFALLRGAVYGCAPASYSLRDKGTCLGAKRFRPICPNNPNNKYRDEFRTWFFQKYWPYWNTGREENRTRVSLNGSMTVSEARRKGIHFGVDVLCSMGSSVQAPCRGRVTYRDDNKVILKGISTFKGFFVMMKNFNVSRSVFVNQCVSAGHHIGYTTEHDEPQGTTSYAVHIEVKGKDDKGRWSDMDPSFYICPAYIVKDGTEQRLAFHGNGFNRLRLIFVDHDKATEEAKVTDNEDENEGEDFDEDDDELSGDAEDDSSTK